MANLGRLHLAVSTSHSDQTSPAQAAGVLSRCCVVLPLQEFRTALETLSQNFIVA